eukprot:TRINITY_DN2668_c0_g1_i12.p1 TRINITY_DN2668_c0_g1~~TRINITY_DN2668_c0_g1_i12.p1  ORF type:complete len:877 (+),score=245.44 TRINITY_DN2668_c0_g1_i12:95-2725(+)
MSYTPTGIPISYATPSGYPSTGYLSPDPAKTKILADPHGKELEPTCPVPVPPEKLLARLLAEPASLDPKAIQKMIAHHTKFTLGRTRFNFDTLCAFLALAHSVRDQIIHSWNATQAKITNSGTKRVYYMSMEYLIGRSLRNMIYNMGILGPVRKAVEGLEQKLEDLYEKERDAALGNGGLGRLAACFMDSLATLDYPVWGYGVRYTYGMFEQQIRDGDQSEFPDYWLTWGNPWEIERLDVNYAVGFYGKVVITGVDDRGKKKKAWIPFEKAYAVAYDVPVPGYNTSTCLNVRLWSAKPSREFDLGLFSQGDYFGAIAERQKSENITSVLYPADHTWQGKELRLRQEFFFSSATIQDIIRRFKRAKKPWSEFSENVAIHLNDTHPALAIVEFMRILVDGEDLAFEEAWEITKKSFAYTNHTVLPEALEKWPLELISNVLPRHLELIFEINWAFLEHGVSKVFPGDVERRRCVSLIEEGFGRMVRMAHVAIVGSYSVNGVAAIHSDIIKADLFRSFHELSPEKFTNVTNGVTPRRWLLECNEGLAKLYETWLSTNDWVTNMSILRRLEEDLSNPDLFEEWESVKRENKVRLAKYIEQVCGIEVNIDSIFDVHIKRIHEYKRQLLNILSVIDRYDQIKRMSLPDRKKVQPRTIIFAGKAAPGYLMAKRVIKLINSVAEVVNQDQDVGDLLKVIFIPNYNVSVAELIIPASDLSQHISTAGKEASGTSNMKFAMNGCLIIGTMDGANVEICKAIGEENIFIFGTRAEDVGRKRDELRRGEIPRSARLSRVFSLINKGSFGPPEIFIPILDSISREQDEYIIGVDYPDYMEAQARVDATYADRERWTKMSILSSVRSGDFSSDRSVKEYAEKIWKVKRLTP